MVYLKRFNEFMQMDSNTEDGVTDIKDLDSKNKITVPPIDPDHTKKKRRSKGEQISDEEVKGLEIPYTASYKKDGLTYQPTVDTTITL